VEALITSGRIADIALAVMIVEAVLLYAYLKYREEAERFRSLLANLAAGGCLVVALKLALVGAAWQWIAVALAASLFAHAIDLWSRLRFHSSR
jgi:hypothetical protein